MAKEKLVEESPATDLPEHIKILFEETSAREKLSEPARNLNAASQFDAYPLPRIDETFEALSGSHYFTILDLLSGYWQVDLTEAARMKSAFTEQ